MPKDIAGNEIRVGDKIAYAMRWGDSSILGVYEILDISGNTVKAQQIELGSRWKAKRASSLHGDLFSRKAYKIS